MKWKKIGKIFDPSEHDLPGDCFAFAQSPQSLVFDDFVRIYFSTRSKDPANDKYLSHVAFADFSRDLEQLIRVSDTHPIGLGNLGCFDEHGIFPMNVLRVGEKIYAYPSGWTRRVSVSVDTGIGLAISRDEGLSFQRVGEGPVLTSSLHEPCLVGDPFVMLIDGTFHMWYIFGTGWKRYAEGGAPDRTYKIGHAISPDGISWEKEESRQIISDQLSDSESQALPTVIELDGRYHMYFCYRESFDFRNNRNRGYRLGYAHSDDLVDWVRDDENIGIDVSPGSWDSDMMCYPHLFSCEDKVYLLYNGNEFGRLGFGAAILEST